MISAIVGLNWGDEGKGRMVDYLASKADCVIRYQGGDNAGHTIQNDKGKFALHNLPSGICYENTVNIIASGSVLNPESFYNEHQYLKSLGLSAENIIISDRAMLILPFHPLLDRLEEERLKDRKYGSTLSGIAPVYGQRYLKKGIQAGELLYPEYLKEHLTSAVEYNNSLISGIYGSEPVIYEEIYEWLMEYGEKVKPYIADTMPVVQRIISEGKNIILEAQLGALRDINHGIYPFTTSSSTLAGYACSSVPVLPSMLGEVIGVTKAYSTCVGEGPFVTEIKDSFADEIRDKAGEYGAKTGRPRRIGYFDAVATAYGCRLQGATAIALTCLDVLSGYCSLKVCTAYEIDGKPTSQFPLNPELLKAKPVYETLEGWNKDISGIRKYDDLPVNTKKYIEKIEQLTGTPVKYVSVGPEREALIVR